MRASRSASRSRATLPGRGRTTSSGTRATSTGASQSRRAATASSRQAADTRSSGRTRYRGYDTAVLADFVAPAAEARRLLRRAISLARGARVLIALPAPEHRGAFLSLGFLPAPHTLHFMGKPLAGRLTTRSERLALHARRHGLLLSRLVFVTQQVDPGHPALAATVPKIRALAERVDEVVVLADRAVAGALPDNCRSLSFAARSRAGRGARFEHLLARELARRPRPLAVVAHMCPIYAVLAAPLVRPLRVPLLLWYTHWARTRTLVTAARAVTAIVSVDRRSVPVESKKVVAIGHGIDLAEFPCADRAGGTPDFRLVVLGRYSRAKGLETVIRGTHLALERGLDVRLELHGPALNAAEREHRAELERLVVELALRDVSGSDTRCCAPRCRSSSAGRALSSTTCRQERRTRSSSRRRRAAFR